MKMPPQMRLRTDMFLSKRHIGALTGIVFLRSIVPSDAVFWAVITRAVILVRDLVAKSEKLARAPITFTDDVIIEGTVKDVSSLITFMRDALCHIESDRHMAAENIQVTLNVAPREGLMFKLDEFEMRNDYDDDIALFVGRQRMYVERHLLRAYRMAISNLDKYLEQFPDDAS